MSETTATTLINTFSGVSSSTAGWRPTRGARCLHQLPSQERSLLDQRSPSHQEGSH
ncbi:hypothetical protein AKJ16_DCAP18298 [Drosera capensis]